MQYTHCAVADGQNTMQYLDGPYTLEELMDEELLEQHFTTFPGIVAVWIPAWQTWEVWYN